MQRNDSNSFKLDKKLIGVLLEYFPQGVVAFDLEMTGLSPLFDKIIEIAAVKLKPDGSMEFFHELVNPLIPIPEHTIKYHGITNDDVKDKLSIKKPLKAFMQFFGNYPLLAHNAQFDIGYIVKASYQSGFSFSLSSVFDSCKFSRQLYKQEKENKPENFKLNTLAGFFEIKFNHHRALDDAYVSLAVFANCLLKFKETKSVDLFKEMSFLFKLNSFKRPLDYILPKKLLALKESVQKQQQISIKYKGGTKGSEFRPIIPVSVLPMPNGLVLYAKCLLTEHNKHFLIKKIKDIKL